MHKLLFAKLNVTSLFTGLKANTAVLLHLYTLHLQRDSTNYRKLDKTFHYAHLAINTTANKPDKWAGVLPAHAFHFLWEPVNLSIAGLNLI